MTSTEELNGTHCYCWFACALVLSSVVPVAVTERLGTVQKIFVRQLVLADMWLMHILSLPCRY